MRNKPIRILHIVACMNRGGLETFIMNIYRKVDRSKVQFDFLVHRKEIGDFEEEIHLLGGRVFRVPRLNPISLFYRSSLDSFFKQHCEYEIVHAHMDCMSAIPLSYAKKYNVRVRIAHSHCSTLLNGSFVRNFLKRIYLKKITKYSTDLFACSTMAGKFMFQMEKFTLVKNAIDVSKYRYDSEVRNKIRKKIGVDEEFVIGHVGRFDKAKNHEFLLDIFVEVLKFKPASKLLLVGDGVLRKNIESKAKKLNIYNKIIFTGVRADVSHLLQAMDVFLFPSLFEGFGISLIEAQASGLDCLTSADVVPAEVKVSNHLFFENLSRPSKFWASKVLLSDSSTERSKRSSYMAFSGFDINTTADWLQEFYTNSIVGNYNVK